MKVEVHSIRYGSPAWLLECAPTLDSWVERHGYSLRIWTMEDNKPEYPCLKFCEVDMWRQFLEGDSEWCMYVDGDIYVRHDAPTMEWLETAASGMYLPRALSRTNGRFACWCRKYKVPNALPRDWWFRNAGWWVIDRPSAEKLLRVVSPPYYEGTMEECQMNLWLATAAEKHGLRVASPPAGWVNYYWLKRPSWMWHLAHPHNKMRSLGRIKAEGKV